MRVLILAAGLGTRLRPITDTIPKCLVSVGEKPMLEHWLTKLEKIHERPSEVFVNLFYKKELVKEFLANYSTSLSIINIIEDNLLGTGGTFLNLIQKKHDEDMLVIHCDNYYDDDLNEFLEEALTKLKVFNCDGVILSFRAQAPELCGTLEIDVNGKITNFQEKIKSPKSNLANGAVYLFSAQFLEHVSKNYLLLSDIAKELLEPNNFDFYSYETSKFFCDIGTNDSLNDARKYAENKK